MGGLFGIGGSSAKTDRGNQLAATSGLWNVFGYGLDTSKASQKTGQENLGDASAYFKNLLTAGRPQVAANSAPAVNASLQHTDAARRQEASTGTGRSGGTVAANREASATGMKEIDDIINANMVRGREEGAKGLESVGGTELADALSRLGVATGADTSILSNATDSRKTSQEIHDASVKGYGEAAGSLLKIAFGL